MVRAGSFGWFVVLPLSFIVGASVVVSIDWILRYKLNRQQNTLKTEKAENSRGNKKIVVQPAVGLLDLPESLLYEILSFLDPVDLCAFSRVSHHSKRLANDQYLWRNLVRRDFFSTEFTPEFEWKQYYKQWEIQFRSSYHRFIFCCQNGITEGYFEDLWKLERQKSEEQRENPMYHAVLYGRAELVEKLIGMKMNPNGYLYSACKALSVDTVRILLEHGVEPNESASVLESPIHFVAGTDNVELMKLLLEHSADVNELNFRSQTPLQISVQQERVPMAEFLLRNNADPNIPVEYSGDDPLPGIPCATPEMVNLLIRYGSHLDSNQAHWFGVSQ